MNDIGDISNVSSGNNTNNQFVSEEMLDEENQSNVSSNLSGKNKIIKKSSPNDVLGRAKKYIKLEKINDINFVIPKPGDHEEFINKNYRTFFLKEICKFYKLKVSGNKPILVNRIYKHFIESVSALVIQKCLRRYLVKIYINLLGPALYNRSLCKNDTDFFTLDKINKIPYTQFYSYKANDNSIWGFNIVSLYTLFTKTKKEALHPYTREKLSFELINNLLQIIKLSKILNIPTNVALNNNDIDTLDLKKRLELRCLDLFQYMDELGNYTNSAWFLSLTRLELIKFIGELRDIWEYRAQLSDEIKKEICPHDEPFRFINAHNIISMNLSFLQKASLSIIELLIKSGLNRDIQNLGASYVLCALTLVNNDAANALPWLYQSVAPIN